MKIGFSILFFFSFNLSAQLLMVNPLDSEHSGRWEYRKKGDAEWKTAQVPGNIFSDLLRNKIIPDPFIDDNEKKVQWVESCDWEYKAVFTLSQEELSKYTHTDLIMEGIDTYAQVFLNDSLIFVTDNFFRKWQRDVRTFLRSGNNNLLFVFESSVKRAKSEAAKLTYTLPEGERVFNRQPQYLYGWDFAPRLVGCGITKPVKLEFWRETRVRGFHIEQIKTDSSVSVLRSDIELESDAVQKISLKLESTNQSSKVDLLQNVNLKKGLNKIAMNFSIQKPELWWCNGMGHPRLYVFNLIVENTKKEKLKAEKIIGIRNIELVQKKDSSGKSFFFKLNGQPVFMKGANYIPPDALLGKTPDFTFPLTAATMNMNMLRVWGGGTYPSDDFYSQCDEHGILVWQDFMFACAMYPGDKYFIKTVSQEIMEQVKRLRDHPCLALWCGNNEIDEGWKNWGWQKQYHYSKNDSAIIYSDYKNLFEKIIPQIVRENDPRSSYWPSSPGIGWGHKESLQEGDSHYWGVWWGNEPFETYQKKAGRFMSEYGFQGMPSYWSFKKFCTDIKPDLNSISVKAHQKHPRGFETIQKYLQRDYKTPAQFEDYIYVSQLVQANGMKTAIETHRRTKPYCMGSLFWQMNDCWPATSWSAIDYYGTPKALYYYSKILFKTVLISTQNKNNTLEIIVVSDSTKKINGNLNLQLVNFKNQLLWEKTVPAGITNHSSFRYYVNKNDLPSFDTCSAYLNSEFIIGDKSLATSRFYFTKPKFLSLPEVKLNVKKINSDSFEVSADAFAKDINLYNEDHPLILSENFFDLKQGEKKTIKIVKFFDDSIINELHAIILNNLINLQ